VLSGLLTQAAGDLARGRGELVLHRFERRVEEVRRGADPPVELLLQPDPLDLGPLEPQHAEAHRDVEGVASERGHVIAQLTQVGELVVVGHVPLLERPARAGRPAPDRVRSARHPMGGC
jgi:hypothetical protein